MREVAPVGASGCAGPSLASSPCMTTHDPTQPSLPILPDEPDTPEPPGKESPEHPIEDPPPDAPSTASGEEEPPPPFDPGVPRPTTTTSPCGSAVLPSAW